MYILKSFDQYYIRNIVTLAEFGYPNTKKYLIIIGKTTRWDNWKDLHDDCRVKVLEPGTELVIE